MECYYRSVLVFFTAFALSGCMAGPNFHQPDAPQTSSYNEKPLPAKTVKISTGGKSGIAQTYAYGMDLSADWWHLFRSPAINELVNQGLQNNQNMAAAQAALRQAQETLYANIGNLMFPAFNANLGGERQRTTGTSVGTPGIPTSVFNTVTASVSVSYNLDLFGASRRQLESLLAQVDYQQFQLLGTYITLTTNIVTTAISIASLQEQIKVYKELLAFEENQLNILRKQYKLGGVDGNTILTQQTQVEQTRGVIPPLEQSLSQSRHALAVLIGAYPNTPLPKIELKNITLPAKVPVSIPSRLVRQRPDIRASEALLHAASAQVGVATANLYPQFNITGNYGWAANTAGNLFHPQTAVWDIAGQLTQPIFHGGALLAQRRAAIAAYDQSAAQYKQTVLQAFQNVADALRAIETDARKFKAQDTAKIAARKALKITTEQFRLGGVSYLSLLIAQQQYQKTIIASVQAQAARFSDTAVLYQAMGGGWWNRKPSECDVANRTNVSLYCPP